MNKKQFHPAFVNPETDLYRFWLPLKTKNKAKF